MSKINLKLIIASLILFLGGGILGGVGSFSIRKTETETIIESSSKIILSNQEIPTVEIVDDGKEIEEGGQGYAIDVTSPETVKDATLGKCIDLDGKWGSQCWDEVALISENQTGRRLTTCGTGKAKGMMDCWVEQAGEDYEVNWDSSNIKIGEIVVFSGGEYGHTGIALSEPEDGYILLLGANQGGEPCDGGGSAVNIIRKSLKDYIGGYLWKAWEVQPKPEPVIPETGCVIWHLEQGDTMSKIMLECENTIVYGKAMDDYAKTWYSLIYKPNQSVYDGWYHSENGVGLYAGDDIEHKTGE